MLIITVIIFQGIIFTALVLLMRHFMKGHVTGAVDHLQKMNDELLKQQTEFKEKASEAEKEFAAKLARMQQEITTKQAQARQEASKLLEETRDKAMHEREKLINEAIQTREKMRQEVMGEMEEKAIFYSKEVISHFLTGEIRDLVHEGLIRESLAGLRDANLEQFQIQSDTVEVVSAEALTRSQKDEIEKILRDKMKKDIRFTEQIDPNLIGGMILRFDTLVVDGSLTNRLKEASARMKKDTARKYQAAT